MMRRDDRARMCPFWRTGRRRGGAAHARVGSVPDDARHVGDERGDRDRGRGCRHGRHRHPDGDHAVHIGDGDAHDHRGQGRGAHRPQARLRARLRDLRGRLVHDRDLAVADRAAHRVVVPGGRRRRAHPASDRRARRRQLPPRRSAARLRPGHGGGSDRRRDRAAHRRPVHDLPQLATGLRGRGAHRADDPRAGAPDRGRAPGKAPRIDVLGIVLSAAGLGLAVFGVLRSSVWGWVNPSPTPRSCSASRR